MAKQVQVIEDLQEIDEMETELIAKAETAAKVEKKEKAEKVAKEPKIGPTQIGAAGIAEMLGITARDLRMFLRKHFRDMNAQKGQTYIFEKDSKEVQDIIDAYKAAKSAPRVKKEKAPKAEAETATETATVAELPTATMPIDLDNFDLEEDEINIRFTNKVY